MEFGKLDNVDHIDWSLPADDPSNADYLNAFAGPTRFYLGAPAWGCKEWIGKLYPPKTPPAEFLYHYARNFNCIELNTTHYRIPDSERVRAWRAQVPPDFIFCPKIPQLISHRREGLRDRETRNAWFDCLTSFGENLGPSFIQLPPYFDYGAKAELFDFLKAWPSDFELCLELRHPSWFEDGRVLPALTDYLRSRNIGLVILDVSGRRDLVHSSLSAPYSLLRLIGNSLHPSDFKRADSWCERLTHWTKLPRFYFMVHQPEDLNTPEMSTYVIDKLNSVCNAKLIPIAKPLL